MAADDVLALLDWRRRIFALYEDVRARAATSARDAWWHWRGTRDDLFREHSQSPVPASARPGFGGLAYYEFDPELRVSARLVDRPAERIEIVSSTGEPIRFTRIGSCLFELAGADRSLDAFWLEAYGGGLFVPFRDATAGRETYGAGRYLLDTAKGADLGSGDDGGIVLDFNFAYNPSCAYDPRWSCPLAPPANRLDVEVRAGERVG